MYFYPSGWFSARTLTLPALIRLSLDYNSLWGQIDLVCEALCANVTLTNLTLARNYLTPQSAVALATVLATNKTITKLDLKGANFFFSLAVLSIGEFIESCREPHRR
jgi:hypothetical protein